MTKKDYIRAANMISNDVFPIYRTLTARLFARFFSENPRFNYDKFMQACGLKPGSY